MQFDSTFSDISSSGVSHSKTRHCPNGVTFIYLRAVFKLLRPIGMLTYNTLRLKAIQNEKYANFQFALVEYQTCS